MDLNNIATVFGPTLLSTPSAVTSGQTDVTFHFQIQGQVLRAILGQFFLNEVTFYELEFQLIGQFSTLLGLS